MDDDVLAIIGVGLMGASVGMAAKAHGTARHVIGYDFNSVNLQIAMDIGAIDQSVCSLSEITSLAKNVIVATPVHTITETILQLPTIPGWLTDIGSTKRRIVETITQTNPHIRYLGSHPMAGSEKKGPQSARADMFTNRAAILTPTETTNETVKQSIRRFWTQLGCRIVEMPASEHDTIVAAVSHLPHAIAAALAKGTLEEHLPLSAGGWKDTTRIAAAGSAIWTPIFQENRESLLASIDRFDESLNELRRHLLANDGPGITAWLDQAKRVRDALGN